MFYEEISMPVKSRIGILLILLLVSQTVLVVKGQGINPAFDADAMIRMDGKRIFVLGLYQKPKVQDGYAAMAREGYNLVSLSADSRMLDSARVAGIKGWITLGTIDSTQRTKSWIPIKQKIEQLRSNPALLAWEIADEPSFSWNSSELRIVPKLMKETRDSIRSADISHPIYLNHAPVNLVETLKQYNGSNDLTACDIYPVIPSGIKPMYALNADGFQGDLTNTTLSQVGDYVDKMRTVCGPNRPLLMVLQGFAWEMLRPVAERDSSKIRYPTFNESWFMAWDAILHGSNGLIWWGTAYVPENHPFLGDLAKVSTQLSSIQDVLTLPDLHHPIRINYVEMGHSINKGIEVKIRKSKDTIWILTANTERYPVRAELFTEFTAEVADVLFENRRINLHQTKIADDYQPYQVHLYKLRLLH